MSDLGRILIADNDEPVLQVTANLLRRVGHVCDCASDAEMVIEMLGKNKYNLLVTDINMPGNTNLEMIKELSKISDGTPVILMTSDPYLVPSIQSVQPPVVACLIKPFDFSELLEHVKTSIGEK